MNENIIEFDTSGIECDEDGNVISQNVCDYDDDSYDSGEALAALPQPSEEQENIIKLVAENNVLVDSVAGCGKTTTVVHTSLRYPESKILLLMYNKRLKEETKKRIRELGLKNVEVQNFHSFFVRHYEGDSFTDVGLAQTVNRDNPPKTPFTFDLIVIDEAQDLKLIFYRSFCKIHKDNLFPNPRIMILGDKFQNIYKFLGSDERFLIYAPKIFTLDFAKKNQAEARSAVAFKEAKLSISYRLTRQTANFINKCTLGYDRIVAIKDGPLPKYIVCNLYSVPLKIVRQMIEKYGYENIFIVSNSVKSAKSPLRHIANKLSADGIPIFVPQSDDADIDERVIAGKLVFTTYNQTKGLERDCVFVFNIDEWNPESASQTTPNAVYVAMTRAKTQLIMFHSEKSEYANFMIREQIPKYAEFIIYKKFAPTPAPVRDPSTVSVASLVEYLSGDVIDKACSYFTAVGGDDGLGEINIPTTVNEEGMYEEVSDITGVMLPAYYEYLCNGTLQIYTHMKETVRVNASIPTSPVTNNPETIRRLLHMANLYISSDSGYMHKMAQIKNYNWVTPENIDLVQPRLKKHIGVKENEYEYKVSSGPIHGKTLIGSIDCVAGQRTCRVYEFKCVNTLKRTHLIQLALYAYLLETGIAEKKYNISAPRKYFLLNLLTGKYYRIEFTLPNLALMTEFLIITKFFTKTDKTDKVFFNEISQAQLF